MTPPVSTDTLDAAVRRLAEEATDGTDLFVVDVTVRGRQGGRVVEVFADSEAGAGLDDLAELSRRLAFLLDTEDPIKGQYRLDVSTPGADRPLSDPRQFAHHAGRSLDVEFADGGEVRSVTGSLVGVDGDRQFEIDPGDGSTVTVPFSDLRSARVLLPW